MEVSAVARRLKVLRLEAGLSMAAVARHLGFTHASRYQHYEDRFKRLYLPVELAERLSLLFAQNGVPASEIASQFDITGPAVSQHLKVLREAGLVNERRDGTRHLFSANRLALRALRDHLAWMWDDSLADLKRSAETEARTRKRRDR